MVGALVLHQMCVSPQNKELSCGIFGNNYDLGKCALKEVAQIFDIIYRLWLTSATPPRAELAVSKPLCFKNASRTIVSLSPNISYLDPFALCLVC